MKLKILVSRATFPDVLAQLQQRFDVESNQEDRIYSAAELHQKMQGKDGVIVTSSEQLTADLIAASAHVKVISNVAVGYNNIDIEAATRAGIMVTNTPDVLNETTADHAWTLLMASARRVSESERWLREGNWKNWRFDQFLGADVHGATLGVLGMGRIGQAIARRSIGFDMQVIYHNRTRLPAELEARANNACYVGKEELLRQADHLVVMMPYSASTHHVIAAAELALMKSTATLVNIARGGIVEDVALIAALREGRLASAGLDVYENEPSLHPDFLELPNVVLTPHIGSASAKTRRAMVQCAVDNLVAALDGQRPPNLVNQEVAKG